ncbi:unnamed protein product, partial [Ectocarpus sp. 4 AP-2014]
HVGERRSSTLHVLRQVEQTQGYCCSKVEAIVGRAAGYYEEGQLLLTLLRTIRCSKRLQGSEGET